METHFKEIVSFMGLMVEGAGVCIIIIGLLLALFRYLFLKDPDSENRYRRLRQDLGKAILLGLEFLVAGDIVRTVAVAPTRENIYVLGLVVLIRTFLSMSLQVELEGRWPWQRKVTDQRDHPGSE